MPPRVFDQHWESVFTTLFSRTNKCLPQGLWCKEQWEEPCQELLAAFLNNVFFPFFFFLNRGLKRANPTSAGEKNFLITFLPFYPTEWPSCLAMELLPGTLSSPVTRSFALKIFTRDCKIQFVAPKSLQRSPFLSYPWAILHAFDILSLQSSICCVSLGMTLGMTKTNSRWT